MRKIIIVALLSLSSYVLADGNGHDAGIKPFGATTAPDKMRLVAHGTFNTDTVGVRFSRNQMTKVPMLIQPKNYCNTNMYDYKMMVSMANTGFGDGDHEHCYITDSQLRPDLSPAPRLVTVNGRTYVEYDAYAEINQEGDWKSWSWKHFHNHHYYCHDRTSGSLAIQYALYCVPKGSLQH